MKRTFVGGFLVEDNKLLLVKRAANDSNMGGLWSLPGGGIESGEYPEKALLREFKEETNLDVVVLQKLFVFRRASFDVVIFRVSAVSGTLMPIDNDIEHLYFFDFNNFPEHIAIDSLLCIINYQLIHSIIIDHISITIDKVFASIFYSYLSPYFHYYDSINDTTIYKYIIESTPYRKFKSVVPFLLSNCSPELIHLFIIPEFCYAIWTLLDDCHDEKHFRYGVETALRYFGVRISVIALFKAIHNINIILCDKLSKTNIDILVSSLAHSATILYQRNLNCIDTGLERYIDQSIERTMFLRTSWRVVLEESGYDANKIDFVYNLQIHSSAIGQLINDYFDIVKGGLEDFDNRTASMHSLLIRREANVHDQALLYSLWLNNQSTKEEYRALLIKYDIERILHQIIADRLDNIIRHIRDSDLDPDEKCILIAWHQMSFIHFKKDVNDVSILRGFLGSVDRMLYRY